MKNVQTIAGKFNVIINTFPITSLVLQEIIALIQSSSAWDFMICPIISKIESSSLPVNLIVDSAICPQFHSRFEGEIITTKINNNIMTFCCNGCVDAFQTAYNKITSIAV